MELEREKTKTKTPVARRPWRRRALAVLAEAYDRWQDVRGEYREELSQALVRLVIVSLILVYIAVALAHGWSSIEQLWVPRLVVSLGGLIGLAILVHLYFANRLSSVRRLVGNILDISFLSLFMIFGGAATAPFFPVYIWVILANGFRFGERVMVTTAVLSFIGFSMVTIITPFWRDQISLALGLLVALATLPAYMYTLLKRLNESKAQAEEANQAKNRFLATVSHEIRTPLNAIVGLSDILRGSRLEVEQREMIQSIGISAESLMELMGDLLNFSKIEAGALETRHEPFSFYKLLADIEAMVLAQARPKGLLFSLRSLSPVPETLIGDRQHVKEILINLAANAVKYTDSGSITITIEQQPAVNGDANMTGFSFKVADTGIGIQECDQKQIFENFTQTGEARASGKGGVGLGLSICRRLVEGLDGSIEVSSKPGEGSTFTVTLPFGVMEGQNGSAKINLQENQVRLVGDLPAFKKSVEGVAGEEVMGFETRDPDDLMNFYLASGNKSEARSVVAIGDDIIRNYAARQTLDQLKRSAERPPVMVWASEKVKRPSPSEVPDFIDLVVRCRDQEEIINSLAFITARSFTRDARPSVVGLGDQTLKLNVLVAEDNHMNRMVVGKILQALGHQVTHVENGEEALEAMAAFDYDAVLMDVNMPVTNGLEATRMRRYEELGDERTPIIGLTADATEDGRQQCFNAGMDGVLHKPISRAGLQYALHKIINDSPDLQRKTAEEGRAAVLTHPRFENGLPQIVDMEKLRELSLLDEDGSFLRSVIQEFLTDAEDLITKLSKAVRKRQIEQLRDTAHAIQSCAANIGAERILQTAASGKSVRSTDLDDRGAELARQLRSDLDLTARELRQYVDDQLRTGSRSN